MMYENGAEKYGEMERTVNPKKAAYRMAKVTAQSGKPYKYLSSYIPAQGDYVLVAVVGGTHVILGKVV